MKIHFRMTMAPLLLFLFTATLHAEEVPEPERRSTYQGFYKGVILFSGLTSSIAGATGSLLDHDKKFHDELKIANDTGESPLKLFNTPASDMNLFEPHFYNGHQTQMDLEFGVTSHIGLGITYLNSSIHVRRQEQFPFPDTLSADVSAKPMFYTEFIPIERNYYTEKVWMGSITLHPFSSTQIDPYLALRGGGGVMDVAYRKFRDPVANMIESSQQASGTVAGVAVGCNVFLNGEFGIKLEANGYRRFLSSDAFDREGLNSGSLSVGLILNWDNINRYSY